VKQIDSLIAPQEEHALKKWWRLASILSFIFIVVTTACTFRMYRIINEKEMSVSHAQAAQVVTGKPNVPQATQILEQITQDLPGSVAFQTIHLEPNFLLIQGKTLDQHAWANWAEGLMALGWVSNVQVEYLQKISKKANEYSFSVRLCF
jgi:hypothetical protein